MTDLAMFVCGLGRISLEGWAVSQLSRATVGYLTPAEQDHAQQWVLAARLTNDLGGVRESEVSTPALRPIVDLETTAEAANRDFRKRIPNRKVRERHLRYYQKRFPTDTEETLIDRILTDFERDRR